MLALLTVVICLYLLSFLFWFFFRRSKSRAGPNVLEFHKVDGRKEWGITSLAPAKFEKLVSFLQDWDFETVTLREYSRLLDKPADRKALLIFDDAYESVFDNAVPVLKNAGYTAAIFVITGYAGKTNDWDVGLGRKFRHLSWEQIKELAGKGYSFGSHTVNHPDLTRLSDGQVEFELRKSKEVLEDKLGQEISALSYPFGRFNSKVQKLAEQAGYKLGFSLYPARLQNCIANLAIRSTSIYKFDNRLVWKLKLEGGFWHWLEDYKSYVINQFSLATPLLKPFPQSGSE